MISGPSARTGDSDLKDPHAPENEDDIGNLPKF